jgi:hypothetical protein
MPAEDSPKRCTKIFVQFQGILMPPEWSWVVGAHPKQKVNRQLQRDVSVTLGLIPCIQPQYTLAQKHARRFCNDRFSFIPAFTEKVLP